MPKIFSRDPDRDYMVVNAELLNSYVADLDDSRSQGWVLDEILNEDVVESAEERVLDPHFDPHATRNGFIDRAADGTIDLKRGVVVNQLRFLISRPKKYKADAISARNEELEQEVASLQSDKWELENNLRNAEEQTEKDKDELKLAARYKEDLATAEEHYRDLEAEVGKLRNSQEKLSDEFGARNVQKFLTGEE